MIAVVSGVLDAPSRESREVPRSSESMLISVLDKPLPFFPRVLLVLNFETRIPVV